MWNDPLQRIEDCGVWRGGSAKRMSASDAFRVEGLFPRFHDETWVSYTLKSVLEGMRSDTVTVGATVLAKAAHVTAPYVRTLTTRHLSGLIFPRIASPTKAVFRSARRRVRAGDVAYFWLESPAELCRRFSSEGVMVVREMINCTTKLRRDELRKAYAALGEPDRSGITDEMIERERQDLLTADAVFCPNPFVRESVIEYGVPAARCIETSYGWGADRLGTNGRIVPHDGTFTVAFVGTIDVRKGAPVLLEAWARSGIRGRLLLAGRMSRDVGDRFKQILDRADIIQLGHVNDVGSVYRSADVFCFPTWEEGGPQVTLEAMSAGAVPVVAPMGTAGAFSADEDVGIVVSPGDVDALAGALRALAENRDRVEYLKQRARARAADYTWEKVGIRRRRELIARRDLWMAPRRVPDEAAGWKPA